jgi:predicted sulfurtransferase
VVGNRCEHFRELLEHKSNAFENIFEKLSGLLGLKNDEEEEKAHYQEEQYIFDPRPHVGSVVLPLFTAGYSPTCRMYRHMPGAFFLPDPSRDW